jgi:hypothetical protein
VSHAVRRWSLVVAACLITSQPAAASLTEPARLSAVYDFILGARFEQAAAQLADTCPPAPEEACTVLRAVSLWWQILINPESHLLDQRFDDAAATAIGATTAWTRREPRRGESWFYLAGAYAPLVQWRLIRGERLTAAREGKKIKDALEHALRLDPELYDAYFGIGMYHYYADVAPAHARLLRWLLLLPGGDRVQGLREMRQARERGALLGGEADFQLAQITLWYESRPRDALALFESLDARYPSNPIFLERIADACDVYLHDLDASARAWQTLLDRALDDRVASPRLIEARAERKLRDLMSRRAKK